MFGERSGWYCDLFDMPREGFSVWCQDARCPVCGERAGVRIPMSEGMEGEPDVLDLLVMKADLIFAGVWHEHSASVRHRAA